MKTESGKEIPSYTYLIQPTFNALQELGGSGSNEEILDHIIKSMGFPDEVVDYPHKGSTSLTELAYQSETRRRRNGRDYGR